MNASRQSNFGFTLTELVMVMVIATILAAFAASRISTQSFHAEGFANQVTAMVRYAQKIAISQRRTVFVVLDTASNPNSIKLCYTDAGCGGGAVREPPGTNAFFYNTPSGVALAGPPSFSFDALGKPNSAANVTLTVTGDISRIITIEKETGYVH